MNNKSQFFKATTLLMALASLSSGFGVIDHGNNIYETVKSPSSGRRFLNQRQKRKRWASNPHLRKAA